MREHDTPPPAPSGTAARRDRGLAHEQVIAKRLDKPMGALGIVFLFVVLGQSLAQDPPLTTVLATLGWLLWAAFVAELAFRAYIAEDQRRFWKRNWWQVLFLALPFLRFARVFRLLRYVRAGRVLSAAVRGSRSTGRLLSSRIGWVGVTTAIVILAASQLLVALGSYDDYGAALHDSALATINGEPFPANDPFSQVLEVVLAVYSVAVFATLAGALGAYFLRRPDKAEAEEADQLPG